MRTFVIEKSSDSVWLIHTTEGVLYAEVYDYSVAVLIRDLLNLWSKNSDGR